MLWDSCKCKQTEGEKKPSLLLVTEQSRMSAERFFCPYVSKTFICNSATPLSVSEKQVLFAKTLG